MVILHTFMSYVNKSRVFMFCYGYLFGFIRLIKDSHHDEVFIEENNVIVMRNNIWLYDHEGLVAIARELKSNKR